MIEVQ